MFASRHDPSAFSAKMVLALESELVQEKVFNVVVKPFFDLAIKSLGADVGNRLDRLATAFDDRFKVFREELENELKMQRVVHGGEHVAEYVPDEWSQGEEATATAQAATNPPVHTAKNAARKARRKRCRAKMSYARSSLLQLRPVNFQHWMVSSGVDVNPEPSLAHEAIVGRLDHLETVVGSCCPLAGLAGPRPQQHAISAEVLASQCESVRRIQRAWRLHRPAVAAHDVATLSCADGQAEMKEPPQLDERREFLRNRLDKTIAATMSVDSWKYTPGVLDSLSNAFLKVAISIPECDADRLGAKLRASHRLSEGWSMSQSDLKDAAEIDATLTGLQLQGLRNDAALFYMSVGMLQPPD